MAPELQPIVDALVALLPGVKFGYYGYGYGLNGTSLIYSAPFFHPWVRGCVEATGGLFRMGHCTAFLDEPRGMRQVEHQKTWGTVRDAVEPMRVDVLRVARELAAPYFEAVAMLSQEVKP